MAMIERAVAAGIPFGWVAADSVYGVGSLEMLLRRQGKGYVLGIKADHPFNSWDKPRPVSGTACSIAEGLKPDDWQRLSCGEGTKGRRLHDWAYLELADLDAADDSDNLTGPWTRGLLIRRHIADGELAFFTTWCPAGTGIETLVRVEGHRWAIEDSFETAKNELGLDHNETRSWHGWHRHVSLVMLAFALLATIRHHLNRQTPQKHFNGRGEWHRHPIPDPMVHAGNQAYRHQTGSAPNPARIHHRMVNLATRPSGSRKMRSHQKKYATVIIGSGPITNS